MEVAMAKAGVVSAVLLISAIFLPSCGVSRQSEPYSTGETESIGPIAVSATLPHGTVGKAYNAVVSVSGGTAPYQFSIVWLSLSAGLTINPITGTISGTPVTSGTFQFAVVATDLPNSDRGDHRMTLVVDIPTVGITVN